MKRDLNRQWKQYEYKLQDEFRFAAMIALNDASFAMRSELGKHAEETFDKGASNFTKNAFIVSSRATKKNLASDVVAKDIKAAYMIPAINGGTRRKGDPATSKAGIVVPGKAARLNKQGNLGRGYLRKQTARPDTFVGSAVIKGKRQLGVFKRKITKAKNTL